MQHRRQILSTSWGVRHPFKKRGYSKWHKTISDANTPLMEIRVVRRIRFYTHQISDIIRYQMPKLHWWRSELCGVSVSTHNSLCAGVVGQIDLFKTYLYSIGIFYIVWILIICISNSYLKLKSLIKDYYHYTLNRLRVWKQISSIKERELVKHHCD